PGPPSPCPGTDGGRGASPFTWATSGSLPGSAGVLPATAILQLDVSTEAGPPAGRGERFRFPSRGHARGRENESEAPQRARIPGRRVIRSYRASTTWGLLEGREERGLTGRVARRGRSRGVPPRNDGARRGPGPG